MSCFLLPWLIKLCLIKYRYDCLENTVFNFVLYFVSKQMPNLRQTQSDLFNIELFKSQVQTKAIGQQLTYMESTGSTMDDAKLAAQRGTGFFVCLKDCSIARQSSCLKNVHKHYILRNIMQKKKLTYIRAAP